MSGIPEPEDAHMEPFHPSSYRPARIDAELADIQPAVLSPRRASGDIRQDGDDDPTSMDGLPRGATRAGLLGAGEGSSRDAGGFEQGEPLNRDALAQLGPDARRRRRLSGKGAKKGSAKGWKAAVAAWWEHHIYAKVDADKRRDHLALERTFLGYLRTSLMLSMTAIFLLQLFLLDDKLSEHAPSDSDIHPPKRFVGATGMAVAFITCSMLIVLVGALRFFRQQNAMIRGKAKAGGLEIWIVWSVIFGGTIAVLVLVLIQD